MVVECHMNKDLADYYIEAYTKDYFLDDNKVVHESGVTRLCYIAGYRDYETLDPTENALLWLELLAKVKEVYSKYQDGEVTVKLVIKEDYVNV